MQIPLYCFPMYGNSSGTKIGYSCFLGITVTFTAC